MMGRVRFLPEAGPAPGLQWLGCLAPAPLIKGPAAAVAMGMLCFSGARARGMERERGLISQPLLSTAIIVPYRNTIHRVVF